MGTLLNEHAKLESKVRERLARLIAKKGIESEYRSDMVLKVKEEQMFNLDGGRYLTEISARELIDNDGHSYNLSCLT